MTSAQATPFSTSRKWKEDESSKCLIVVRRSFPQLCFFLGSRGLARQIIDCSPLAFYLCIPPLLISGFFQYHGRGDPGQPLLRRGGRVEWHRHRDHSLGQRHERIVVGRDGDGGGKIIPGCAMSYYFGALSSFVCGR